MQGSNISIRITVRHPVSKMPFDTVARYILGPKYELSLVICGDDLAQRMNKEYRKKTYKPNVLSFPISKTEGEIFLNVRCAAREAKKYGTTLQKRLALLFVHGCFHLKGLAHGLTMERAEMQALRKFGLE